ncbi:histidinol-phosphatase [uncultured Muribaculum sp.]|uniref:histidinol-phosphatase n=2 Tax=uncultured Muribaculum sp. TaxID=1918613 RepID=UPI0026262100|nr:histidinol-phosphatase [uncultured Muribaculum sp.]
MPTIDICKIISSTPKYNFHSHTQFCDGKASMRQIVEAAINAGFKHWGFSPHSPVPIESSCNMSMKSVPEYMEEINRLRQEYGSIINIYASMEVDYLGNEWGAHIDYFKNLNLDYIISSVHFIQAPDGTWVDIDGKPESFINKLRTYFHNDIKGVVEKYFEQSVKMVQTGGFDIIGHLDKIGNNASAFCPGIENEDWYKALSNHLVNTVTKSGIFVEYNTKALRPSHSAVVELLRNNAVIAVNSDAHTAENVNLHRNEKIVYINNLRSTI